MYNFRPLTISRYFAALSFTAALMVSTPLARADAWGSKLSTNGHLQFQSHSLFATI